jgi:hypothetical protein
MGSCQHTDGFQSMGDSPASKAARCSAQPAPPTNPGRLRKMQAPSTTRAWVRSPSLKMPPSPLGVTLEASRGKHGGERGDHPSSIGIVRVSADGAAAEAEMLRRFGTNALATSTPQASPP